MLQRTIGLESPTELKVFVLGIQLREVQVLRPILEDFPIDRFLPVWDRKNLFYAVIFLQEGGVVLLLLIIKRSINQICIINQILPDSCPTIFDTADLRIGQLLPSLLGVHLKALHTDTANK